MKKLATIFVLGAILVSALVLTGVPAYTQEASNIDAEALNEVYAEELFAKNMYEKMAEKFNNDDFYQRLSSSETRHANSIKRILEKYDLKVEEPEFDPEISDDELEALKAALDFEVNDVNSLNERIAKTKNQEEIQHYERLKERSERHVKLLESAIEQFEQGDKDLSEVTCSGNCGKGKSDTRNSRSNCEQGACGRNCGRKSDECIKGRGGRGGSGGLGGHADREGQNEIGKGQSRERQQSKCDFRCKQR